MSSKNAEALLAPVPANKEGGRAEAEHRVGRWLGHGGKRDGGEIPLAGIRR